MNLQSVLHFTDDIDGSHMPIITLEVMTESVEDDNDHIQMEEDQQSPETFAANSDSQLTDTDREQTEEKSSHEIESKESIPRYELLEYQMRTNGTVICKLCGEILRSRNHWYSHKYKQHIPMNPAPLFQCEQCLVFFKSRKGYIGHLARRHSDVLSDSASSIQTEPSATVTPDIPPVIKEEQETDIELSIPATNVAVQTSPVIPVRPFLKTKPNKVNYKKPSSLFRPDTETKSTDWTERRSREEKLVADIIDRVRRECEAQGSGGAARRGYTRRTTVMDRC